MDSEIPPQSYYFNSNSWTTEMDSTLLNVLSFYKERQPWKASYVPNHILHNVALAINKYHSSNFNTHDVFERTTFMNNRYQTFTFIARTPGVIWDMEEHRVVAHEDEWFYLFEKNDFAKAYYWTDEPDFTKLAYLFDDENVKIEDHKDIIIISSTSNDLEQMLATVDNDEDEVISPPSRKLKKGEKVVHDNDSVKETKGGVFASISRRFKGSNSKGENASASSSCAS